MRPFLDAHFGPYKDKWRCWFGVRLWYLFIIPIITFIFTGSLYIYFRLTRATLLIIFISVQAYIRPFRSKAMNILDLFVMVNATLVTILTLTTFLTETIIVLTTIGFIMVGVVFLLFWIIIIYHIYKVLKCRRRCQRQSTNESVPKHIDDLNQVEESVNISKFTMYHDFDVLIRDLSYEPPELRETLLSDEYDIK